MNSLLNQTNNKEDEEMIERELQDIRNQGRRRGDSPSSSLDEMANINADNVNQIIDKVTQRKIPRKREKLRTRKNANKFDNPPPKRIKAEDTKDLFPIIGIHNEEQKRLAKIAGSISGLAGQLANEARLNQALSRDRDLQASQTQTHQVSYQQDLFTTGG